MEAEKVKILKSEQLSVGKAELRSDGILTFEPDPALMKDYTLSILKEMLDVFTEMTDGTPCPYFCDNRYVLGLFLKEEKEFMAKHFHEFATVFAMTERSPVTRLIANSFVKIQKPKIEIKMFKEKDDAIAWLLAHYGRLDLNHIIS